MCYWIMKNQSNYKNLTNLQLERASGGFIPLAVWAIWGGVASAGFAGGISVGLNRVNRKK